jgi:hypothetical protein
MASISPTQRTIMYVSGSVFWVGGVTTGAVTDHLWLLLPAIIGFFIAVTGAALPTKQKAVTSRYDPIKITKGRCKGKMLMAPADVDDIEYEYLRTSVEADIARINSISNFSDLTCGSLLAKHTIDRIDEELDPTCTCGKDYHRKSGHEAYRLRQAQFDKAKADKEKALFEQKKALFEQKRTQEQYTSRRSGSLCMDCGSRSHRTCDCPYESYELHAMDRMRISSYNSNLPKAYHYNDY